MSSRFPPSSGFNSRDRSPQRFGDRRPPVGPRGPDDGPAPFSRDPPRGPRALVDSPRGGHFSGRGRGYGRTDFRDRDRDRDRDFRDAPPFRRDMDRDWPRRSHDRDRDFDARDNRIGFGRGRSRSPTRDFRDIRDPPGRDFDLGRMRRNSRDSILSASSGGPDGPPPNLGHMSRGGIRGRGRGDWEGGRGRGGRPFFDDRDLFRRRSRSREPWRGRDRILDRDRERDLDRERALDRERVMDDRDRDRDILRTRNRDRELLDRDLDRRDRFERREDWENNRRPDREDRDRPAEFWKRDRPPSRAETRAASGSTTSSHPATASGPAPTAADRLPDPHLVDHDQKPPVFPSPASLEPGRDVQRDDPVSARPDAVRGELVKDHQPKPRHSPPPAAPEVPAFGSVATQISSQYSTKDSFGRTTLHPTQSLEKDSTDVQQRPLAQPPTGPKVERGEIMHSFHPRHHRHEDSHKAGNQQIAISRSRNVSASISNVSPPNAPAAMARPDPNLATNEPFRTGSSSSIPTSSLPRAPPPAPRASSREPSISPRMQSSGIPTGPRALQWQSTSPSSRKGSKQWVRPGYGRTPSTPTAPPKQEPVDGSEGISPVHDTQRPVPRDHSPFDVDEPESGEILPREPPMEISIVSPINLPTRRSSSTVDISGETKPPSLQAANKGPAMIPDFERSSDEEDGENIVFTKEYLDERRQLFEKNMESLRAELPPSPLEDPAIVAFLTKLQLLGIVANQDPVEPSSERSAVEELESQPRLAKPVSEPFSNPVMGSNIKPMLSADDEEPKKHANSERVVSFGPALSKGELEQPTEPVVSPHGGMPSRDDEVSISSIPFLQPGPPTPIADMAIYHDNIATQNRQGATFITHLSQEQQELCKKNELLRDVYLSYYKPWRLAIWELDRMKNKQSMSPAPLSPPVSTVPTTPAPMPEAREGRRYKGNSELDFLNALKASEISAQEELERRRTKVATARPDLGREAIIPNMLEPKENKARIYKDVNNIIECNKALDVFGFLPPRNDFTPEEHNTFTDAFMAHPKKWGKIAESLPGRTFQQCIVHYYLTKEEIKYKAKLNKRWSKRSKGTRKGARPKSNALIADLGVVKPDFDVADDTPAVTDTGRPRRAAAPTFGETPELEGSVPIGRRGQPVRDGELVDRPPARRGGRGGGTRGARRIKAAQTDHRGQMPHEILPTAAPQPHQPLGNEIEMVSEAYGAQETIESAPRDALQPTPRGRTPRGRPNDGDYGFESTGLELPLANKQPDPPYGSLQTTSYWSVPEQRDFPALLGHYGLNYDGIASWMKTKTPTMVKNFYLRNVDNPDLGFRDIIDDVNEKIGRGEPLGPLPNNPSVAPKRRYEATPSSIINRALAPQGDGLMEMEEIAADSRGKTHAVPPQPISVSGRPGPKKEWNTSRFPPLAQASAASPVPSTATLIDESTRAIHAQGGHPNRMRGPRFGYFGDPSSFSPATTSAQDLPASSRHPGSMPAGTARLEPLSGKVYRTSVHEPSHSLPPSAHSRHSSLNQPPGTSSSLSKPGPEASSVHRDTLLNQRSSYSMTGHARRISDSPRPGLSPVKDVPRPGAALGPDAPSRQVPAKRSNIMSILNDEPEDPQPRKRFASEQLPSAQATTPGISSRNLYQSATGSFLEESTMPALPQKSGYGQPTQHQPSSRGYSEYPGYGPSQGNSSTSANTDWMARFDPRAQQTPPQPQGSTLPQQQLSNRASASFPSQGSYSPYAPSLSQPSVVSSNLPVPSPAPTPPPPTTSQRSAYPSVFSQSPAPPPMASNPREMTSQPTFYRPGSPGPRPSMAYGSRQEPPMSAQSSTGLYGINPRQSTTSSSTPIPPPTSNRVQPHSYQQHVQTMVSGSQQPQSRRATPVNLPGASPPYGNSTPPPQSQAGRSMASLANVGRSYTPPSAVHSSMSGSAVGGYAAPPPSAPSSILLPHQRPVGPSSLGENDSTSTHHVYSHVSTQGRVPGSLPPPSQHPR